MEFSSNLSAIHTGTGSPLPGSAIPGVRHSHGPGIGVRVRVRVRRTAGMADPGNGGPESKKLGVVAENFWLKALERVLHH